MKNIKSFEDYMTHYENAACKKDHYWSEIAEEYVWYKKWDKVQSGDFIDLNIKWFEGGLTNITENCLDRHLEKRGDKTAIIWEDNDPSKPSKKYSYNELHREVCRFSNALKSQGIEKGDRVVFYMSMVPELLIGVLATARIGAVHSVVFAGFSSQALAGRIKDCGPKMIITNDQALRGNKVIDLKKITDDALKGNADVKKVLCLKRTGASIPWTEGRDVWLHNCLEGQADVCPPEKMDAEDPLFILYTSGSTGKPKGLLHTTAGYMIWAGETFKNVFQTNEESIYWCTADIGWITGHTYITYGPLLNGTTTLMFEGVPTWPDAGRFWNIVDKYKVSHFYTAPTAIRALEACDIKFVKDANLSSLQVLGSVGEPINQEAWDWYNENIGKKTCPIVDTWWQTETGGIMISPLAGITECIPTCATLPLPGVTPTLLDSDGTELKGNPAQGNLCIKDPWPGMARTIYGDPDRYVEAYFSTYKGYYFTGDGARRDEKGNYRITGRVDDVMNISGHRIGTAEVEDAINQHPSIVESAVVGYPHKIKGQGIYAYVILSSTEEFSNEDLRVELNKIITKIIGPIAKPDIIQIVPGLPKTRSGKIMRRILRKIAANDSDHLGDISTLLNPEVVEKIKASAHL